MVVCKCISYNIVTFTVNTVSHQNVSAIKFELLNFLSKTFPVSEQALWYHSMFRSKEMAFPSMNF